MTNDLFQHALEKNQSHAPLASRMRPRQLNEVVGQEHLLSKGRPLFSLVSSQRIPSMVLWGPPGTGKTSLARVLAKVSRFAFVEISAVHSGVAELKAEFEKAKKRRAEYGEGTLLFVDEIHRWSKSQQDSLLHAIESGIITLVGATTENPSFELNKALLSRVRIFVLKPLNESNIFQLLERAVHDKERGLADRPFTFDADALHHIATSAAGDARKALTCLEIAVELAFMKSASPHVDVATASEAMSQQVLGHDKRGDSHYDLASAFIKSMRASDPDASSYYLVRALEAGEDPKFLLRRMVILASEDIGNADPQALEVALNAHRAFELLGLPEAIYALVQSTIYLACSPKSNSALTTYEKVKQDVTQWGTLEIPMKIRNAPTGLMKDLGYGEGYVYPHDHGGIAPKENLLPEKIKDRQYYQPSSNGYERKLHERWKDTPDSSDA